MEELPIEGMITEDSHRCEVKVEAGAKARINIAPLRSVEASINKTDFVAFTCDMPLAFVAWLVDHRPTPRLAIV